MQKAYQINHETDLEDRKQPVTSKIVSCGQKEAAAASIRLPPFGSFVQTYTFRCRNGPIRSNPLKQQYELITNLEPTLNRKSNNALAISSRLLGKSPTQARRY